MEEDSVACGLRCFICGRPETEIHTLSKVTQKGYSRVKVKSQLMVTYIKVCEICSPHLTHDLEL